MKTVLSLATLSVGLFLAGCIDSGNQAGQSTDDDPSGEPFSTAASDVVRDTGPVDSAVVSEQARSLNTFAVSLYKHLVEDGGNVFFSPYSITTALGMTEAGARGETRHGIRTALSVSLPGDSFHAAINGLNLSLGQHAGETEGLTLKAANSTWAQNGLDLLDSYLDLLSRYYGAGVNCLDFASRPESSRVIINTWVAEKTEQKIEDLIPRGTITPNTQFVLTNAIYFLGDWRYSFDASLTEQDRFTRLDGSVVSAPMMRLKEPGESADLMHARAGSVRAVDLPYRGDRLRMTVLLPDSGDFAALEQSLTAERIAGIIGTMSSTRLPEVRFPKFSFTTRSMSLKEPLRAMGMADAFSGSADFSGIDGTGGLSISDVLHKAFIAVNETGTEAAGATAVIMQRASAAPPQPFVADRPFVFLIRDSATGAILFMGRILDPTA